MGVIKQNGGISLGNNGNSLLNFNTGKQFAINDPAVLQVGPAGCLLPGLECHFKSMFPCTGYHVFIKM